MKRLIALLSMSTFFLLVGCNPSTSSSNSTSKQVVESKAEGVTIVGQDFAGTYTGKGTADDPTYQYSMHFGKDGQFVQDIIASKGYAGRFTEKGTYKIDKKNKKIVMTIKEVTEERFGSDEALATGEAPTTFYERSKSSSKSPLNKAEDHPIDIKLGAKYLTGSVNGVKLYLTKKATVNYTKHYETEKSKYTKAKTYLSGRVYMTPASEAVSNTIAFKGNQFIWQYGYGINGKGQLAVLQGTYMFNIQSNILTLTITDQSKVYLNSATELRRNHYLSTNPKLFNGTTLQLTLSGDSFQAINTDSFVTWPMRNETGKSNIKNYDTLYRQYNVGALNTLMTQQAPKTVKDLFPTVDDFAKWVEVIWQGSSDEQKAWANIRMTAGFDDDERVQKEFEYSVVMQSSNRPDDPSPGTTVAITPDGQMYIDMRPWFTDGRYLRPDKELQEKYDAYRALNGGD